MNTDLLLQVNRSILAHPESYNQGYSAISDMFYRQH